MGHRSRLNLMDLYLPLAGVSVPWPALLAIGLLVGTLQGFFGVGGGWLTTPTLNILGLPMLYAIGTDLVYTCASGIVGSWRHHRLGNLVVRASVVIGLSGVLGIEASRRLLFFLEDRGLADSLVRQTYILLLATVGMGVIVEYGLRSRHTRAMDASNPGIASAGLPRVWALRPPPLIDVPGLPDGVSVWTLGMMGVTVGALAGFLGTGGGFILVPLLIHLIGLPARQAVAASLLSIAIANGYGTLAYGLDGKVELVAALLMFSGSIVGAQLGATATVYVRGAHLQLLLGITLCAAAAAVALRQLELAAAAAVVMFVTASLMSAVILALLARAWRRREAADSSIPR